MLIQFVVGYGLIKFLDGFAAEAGKSAFERLGRFMGSLRARRQGRSYQVRINDQQAGLVPWIRDDDPPEAFTALADMDLDVQGRWAKARGRPMDLGSDVVRLGR